MAHMCSLSRRVREPYRLEETTTTASNPQEIFALINDCFVESESVFDSSLRLSPLEFERFETAINANSEPNEALRNLLLNED